jgi:hypothetical protein
MKPVTWRLAAVGVLGLVALGVARLGWRPAVPDQPAAWPVGPAPDLDLMEEMQRSERLDRYHKFVTWAMKQRQALTADLVAGRLDLFETAAGFRALQQIKDKHVKPVAVVFSGRTEEEQLCRQVILFVEQHLLNEPNQAAVVARLEKQLQEHLERSGTVRLPEPPRLDPSPEP